VDTPGFDDTYHSEQDIIREISDWLAKTYATGKKLNGLVYLHPINTTRVRGSALLSLRVFEKLCGAQVFKHVFLCSTFWDVVEEATGAAREKELCESEDLWGQMKREGAKVVRITEYHMSKDILLQIAQKPTMALDVQKEVVDDQVDISDTAAARLANKELEKLRAENEAQKKRATEAAAVELEAKEVDNKTKVEEYRKRQEQLKQAQLKLAEQQRVEQERIGKEREADAKRRLKEEKRKQARLEAEARQRLREQMLEEKGVQKKEMENKRRRERLERLNSIRLEQLRFSETIGLDMACLHRAQAMGTIQARIWGLHQQTSAFELVCGYCFRLIGFSPSWRKQSPFLCLARGADQSQIVRRANLMYAANAGREKAGATQKKARLTQRRFDARCLPRGVVDGLTAAFLVFATITSPAMLASRVAKAYISVGDEPIPPRRLTLIYPPDCCDCSADNFDLCITCITKGWRCGNDFHALHPMTVWPI
jgi:hypothetical protein